MDSPEDDKIPQEVTRLLQNLNAGDKQAAGDLIPLVYDELRRLAAQTGGALLVRPYSPTQGPAQALIGA